MVTTASESIFTALDFLCSWLIAKNDSADHPPSSTVSTILIWSKPPHGKLKFSTDATLFSHGSSTGFGMVIRDDTGNFVAC